MLKDEDDGVFQCRCLPWLKGLMIMMIFDDDGDGNDDDNDDVCRRGMLSLHESDGIFDVGKIKWQLVLCLLGVYCICYFSLWKGIHTSGKVRIDLVQGS